MHKKTLSFLGIIILLGLNLNSASAQTAHRNLNIVFIGNSITHGAGLPDPLTQAPPVIAGQQLAKMKGVGKVQVKNVGKSGSTTVDWLPENKQLFLNAELAAQQFAADTAAQLVFSLVLGTNDSAIKGPNGSPISPENYSVNLIAITERLLTEFPASKVIFQYPTWYSENTYNGSMYLKEGLERLQLYFPEIDKVVKQYSISHPNRVFAGDKKVFAYFKAHPALFQNENGQQGVFNLHPNVQGAAVLGGFWAAAIDKAIIAQP
ncbi:GDSL-type esterase/lipase family protein [Pedobacter sp. L105]|uniref:GDSL-type esterase/lipase family protein n=1 Tax=Pedobacter sp. L105 TaxID=1641871 RepID=UPI00131DC3DC|nr:GDSL-type esterase/lipase family protein [Pedobacter sp. L105]